MSVVINDFEIITDVPEDQKTNGSAPEPAGQRSPSIRPINVAKILDREERRRRRLRAH